MTVLAETINTPDLSEATQGGSVTEQAWYALHEPLHAFFRTRVRDEQSAEDLLQEVFLRIHAQAETLRKTEKLESWIYQIARNRLIDYYRRQKPTISLEEMNQEEQEAFVEDLPEEDIQAELAPSVAAMLHSLPEPYREALVLTGYQGLSQRELATHLGLSFSGAKSRVQRAREKLKHLLLECCHFEFDRRGRVIDYQSRCGCCTSGGRQAAPACQPSNQTPADASSTRCCVLSE